MTSDEIRAFLKEHLKAYEGVSEVLKRFEFYRDSGGATQKVTLEILDDGPERGSSRYSCRVTTRDGRTCVGNPAESVQVAMHILHWGDLDKKPTRSPAAEPEAGEPS